MHFKILKGIQFQLSNFDFLFNYHQMISTLNSFRTKNGLVGQCVIVIEFRNDHPVFWRHWNPLLNFYKGRKSPLLVLFSCFQITNLDLDFRTMLYEMGRDLIKKGLAPPKQIFSKDQLLLSITTKAQSFAAEAVMANLQCF